MNKKARLSQLAQLNDELSESHEKSISADSSDEGRLQYLEKVIDKNLQAFYDVGHALKEIKDKELYKAQGYTSFDEYCIERWDIKRAHAYRLIDSSDVFANLSPIGDIIPATESQARPLAKLQPEQQRQVWEKVIKLAPVVQDKPKITAKLVEETVAKITGKDDKETDKPKPEGKRNIFHLSEDTSDSLEMHFRKIRRMADKGAKEKLSKDLIVETILKTSLAELEANGDKSKALAEILAAARK